MKIDQWTGRIVENLMTMGYALYLYRNTPGGREFLTHGGEVRLVQRGEETATDNYFAQFQEREQLTAIAEAFGSFGIESESDQKLKGVVEAQTRHLEDMRSLVFKGKVPEVKR